jgi:hypothetical protein
MPIRPRSLWLLAALLIAPANATAGEKTAVIELFTSQGCSSCPKADKLLGEYAADPRLIALSLSVDYWDYLGWRDTLALHAHTKRQKGYAAYRGDRQIYTPQLVVNGTSETIGNDRRAIEEAVASAERLGGLRVPVELRRDGEYVQIAVGGGGGPAATVWVVSYLGKKPVAIERGENRGKTITYHNVVRSWTKIGDWNGAAVRFSRPIAEISAADADNAAVILQSGSVETPGAIRGAASVSLR